MAGPSSAASSLLSLCLARVRVGALEGKAPLIGAFLLGVCLLTGAPQSAQAVQVVPDTTLKTNDRSDADARAERLFVQGMTEEFLGNHQEAISRLEAVLERAPSDGAVLSALAAVHAAADDRTTALYYARRARDAAPDNPAYCSQLARLQREAGRLSEAAATYEALLKAFPHRTGDRLALAGLYAEADRPADALRTYEIVVDSILGSDNGAAPVSYGDAGTPMSPIAPGGPDVPDVLTEMLSLYRSTGDSAGVSRTLERLVALRPATPTWLRQLADRRLEEGAPDRAVSLYERLQAVQPDRAGSSQALARAYRAAGRPGAADSLLATGPAGSSEASPDRVVADVIEATGINPETLGPLPAFASQVSDTGDAGVLSSAAERLRRVVDASPDHTGSRRLLGLVLYRMGRYAEAAPLLTGIVREHPREVAIWDRAASAHLESDRADEALDLAEDGLLLFPGRLPLLRIAARSHLVLGSPGRARAQANRGIETVPDTSAAERAALLSILGDAHLALEDTAAARGAWERALEALPEQPAVRQKLNRLSE